MSLAKDLEIYKAADGLLAFALKFQLQVPRAYRVAVGQRISEQSVEILLLVARANAARGEARELHIAKLLEQLEAITALLRAAHSSYQRAQNNTVLRLHTRARHPVRRPPARIRRALLNRIYLGWPIERVLTVKRDARAGRKMPARAAQKEESR